MATRQNDASKEALSRLPKLDLHELREQWCRLYKGDASPRLSRELLMRAVAHAQQHKAPPVEHLATQPIEHRSERRQRKVVAADLGEIETARSYCFSRRLDLGNLGQ